MNIINILNKYRDQSKSPMLVVGSNSWLREQVSKELLQAGDVYLMFFPNDTAGWLCAACYVSRQDGLMPFWSYGYSNNAMEAMTLAVQGIVKPAEINWPKKFNSWFAQWIYRCSKISLSDIKGLETYPKCEGETHSDSYSPFVVLFGKQEKAA